MYKKNTSLVANAAYAQVSDAYTHIVLQLNIHEINQNIFSYNDAPKVEKRRAISPNLDIFENKTICELSVLYTYECVCIALKVAI